MNGRHSPVVRVGPGWGEAEDRDLEGSKEEVEVKRQSGKDQNWLCQGQGRGEKQEEEEAAYREMDEAEEARRLTQDERAHQERHNPWPETDPFTASDTILLASHLPWGQV